jgi:cell fate regulator YaaT (PSP1 superfamily)
MENTNRESQQTAESKEPTARIISREPEKIRPIIGIEFKGNRRQLFSNPMEFPFKLGDLAVVRVEKGEDLGRVVHLLERMPERLSQVEFEILRRATDKDIKTLEEYRTKETSAQQICKEKIQNHGLEMKLVDVEYQFDGRKLTFFFTADGRIDFRQLVKDLAATFRTRIELKQIGARDETRRFGGLGPCGRHLCCAVYIVEFCPITTQMAKDQNLPLSPSKISGCCGRLKCCLRHELDAYQEALKIMPRKDTRLMTKQGPALVDKLDIFNRTLQLRYESGEIEMVEVSALKDLLTEEYDFAQPTVEEPRVADDEEEVVPDDENGGCNDATGSIRERKSKINPNTRNQGHGKPNHSRGPNKRRS